MKKERKLTATGVIEEFGNDKQKAYFDKYRRIPGNIKDALIREIETQYEHVKIVKEGRKNIYVLSGKLEHTRAKQDGRSTGNNKLEVTRVMELFIVEQLQNNEGRNKQSLTQLLETFQILDPQQLNLLKGRNLTGITIGKYNYYHMYFNDYKGFLNEFMSRVKNLLDKLAKRRVIDLNTSYMCQAAEREEVKDNRLISQARSLEHIIPHEISKEQYDSLITIREALMSEHSVSTWEISNNSNATKVKAYNQSLDEVKEELNIEYFYEAYDYEVLVENPLQFYCETFSVDPIENVSDKFYSLRNKSLVARAENHMQNKKKRLKEDKNLSNNEEVQTYIDLRGKQGILEQQDNMNSTQRYEISVLNGTYADIIKEHIHSNLLELGECDVIEIINEDSTLPLAWN